MVESRAIQVDRRDDLARRAGQFFKMRRLPAVSLKLEITRPNAQSTWMTSFSVSALRLRVPRKTLPSQFSMFMREVPLQTDG